jgi:hypothetical protein
MKVVQATGEAFNPLKNIQHFLFFNFLIFIIFWWVIFALLDPDPNSESGSISTDLIESGSNPDPQQCTKLFRCHWIPTREESFSGYLLTGQELIQIFNKYR